MIFFFSYETSVNSDTATVFAFAVLQFMDSRTEIDPFVRIFSVPPKLSEI